ncbi:MAG: phosphatase PAP2 family protein [Chromatiaceae bacterium]|nr:phosphatase PAP2 family protein [Chromatiaceae bacterium]
MAEGQLRGFWDRLSAELGARVDASAPSRFAGAAWLWRWALVSLALALALHAACGYHAGFERLNAASALLPGEVWQWLTALGDERLLFALALLIAWRAPRLFGALLLAALIATLYTRGLKPLVDAARPPAVLPPESFQLIGPGHRHASFPSGHSVTAAVFFGVLIAWARHWSLRLLWLALALAAGASRVALGVHWPIDVLAGLAGGALAAWVGVWLAMRWPGLAAHPALHLLGVLLGAAMSARLMFDDAGYPAIGLPLAGLGALTLGVAARRYLPLARGSGARG